MLRASFIIVLAVFMGNISFAQKNNESKKDKRERIHAAKVAFITTELNLSSAEAQVFWPVYNQYEAEITAIRKTRRSYFAQLKKSDELSGDKAYELFELVFETEKTESNIRLKYLKKFAVVLDSKKAAEVFIAEERFKRKLLRDLKKKGPPTPSE